MPRFELRALSGSRLQAPGLLWLGLQAPGLSGFGLGRLTSPGVWSLEPGAQRLCADAAHDSRGGQRLACMAGGVLGGVEEQAYDGGRDLLPADASGVEERCF
jgi:hypothetical protein